MRIFFDTCILVDFLCNRNNAKQIEHILNLTEENLWEGFISVGSFYTLTYLLELYLKREGCMDREERVSQLRHILTGILDSFHISDLDNVGLRTGVNNLSFLDLEDSYQFQSAVNASCEVLLTDNLSDYKQVDHSVMRILSPDRFIELFGS